MPTRNYKSTLFGSGDLKSLTLFDKYARLLDSLATHFCLIGNEIGLVKAAPRSAYHENDGEGYLLISDIQARLRNKRYGSGRNSVNQKLILKHIRSVFRLHEKYFSANEVDCRKRMQLEQFFENEFAASPQIVEGVNGGNFYFEAGTKMSSAEDSEADDKPKRKDLGKKRRRKNDGVDEEEPPEKRRKSSPQSSDRPSQIEEKENLHNLIVLKLTPDQKLGIIPIVFGEENLYTEDGSKRKFEFDLFSLDRHVFARLEKYVLECVARNESPKPAEEASVPIEPESHGEPPEMFDLNDTANLKFPYNR